MYIYIQSLYICIQTQNMNIEKIYILSCVASVNNMLFEMRLIALSFLKSRTTHFKQYWIEPRRVDHQHRSVKGQGGGTETQTICSYLGH